jgi:Domain of unknown function (DUF6484)
MASKTKTQRIDDVIPIGTRRETVRHARVGRLVAVDAHDIALVDYQGNTSGPLPAVVAVSLDREGLRAAAKSHAQAVLLFDGGDPLKPILVGLVKSAGPEPRTPIQALDVKIDGKSVSFEAREEIVLRCGKASITLLKNGKLVIRGAFVESHATGTNRIKGASVKVN